MSRTYGAWAGFKGHTEDNARCVAEVSDASGISPGGWQCFNKRGKGPDGLYCGVHANALKRGFRVHVPRSEP